MTITSDIIALAKSQVGYHEGQGSSGNWDNIQKYSEQVPSLTWSDGQPWCATFVSWLATKTTGAGSLFPITASCSDGVAWFQNKKRWSDYPAIGAQVFYGSGGGSHTGIVYDYDDTYIYTVEGNTNDNGSAEGDGVYLKQRVRTDAYVYGYGYPEYPEGIKSADPAWASVAPKPVPTPTPVYAPFPGANFFYIGRTSALVTELGKALVRAGWTGYKFGPGPVFTWTDKRAVQWFQEKQGWTGSDADGIPGPVTWKLLKVAQPK